MLYSLVEETGEENVIQVITNSASAYVVIGDLLTEKRKRLFWVTLYTHCIDLMLHDIGELPIFKDLIKKWKSVFTFIDMLGSSIYLKRTPTKRTEENQKLNFL